MTLRDDIRGLLAEPGGDSATLLGDLPSDLVSTVLTHFADTAPIEQADALAPLVMQASPVPFDEELDGVSGAPLDDPIGELGLLAAGAAGVEFSDHDLDDLDPVELDAVELDAGSTADSDVTDETAESITAESEADDFGSGSGDAGDVRDGPADDAVESVADAGDSFGYVAGDADPMDFDALDATGNDAVGNDAVLQPVDEPAEAADPANDFDDLFD